MEGIWDFIIIGSGFGGSVSALRLSEKGYSVAVIEQGRRYADKDFPETNRNPAKYLWMPKIRWFGPQNMVFFKESFILGGVGVGGGSLIYANTHMIPPDAFFKNPVWAGFKDWKSTLMPYYNLAMKMLGTVPVDRFHIEDEILRSVAEEMGRGHTWKGVNAGVYFGDPEKPVDPYFNGRGPLRNGCRECAGCMLGCRYNAKNTLDKNYLWFAEKNGVRIFPETRAWKVEYIDGIYHIHTRKSTSWRKQDERVFKARNLVVAGGVLGTLNLLLRQKYQYKTLPALSPMLGKQIRTNSKSICGVTLSKYKLNNGIAITSIFAPDDQSHIEIVKYPDRGDGMRIFATLLTGKGPLRGLKMLWNILTHPRTFLRMVFNPKWAENSILIMVMQVVDSAMEMRFSRFPYPRLTLHNKSKKKVPVYNEIAQEVTRRYARHAGGVPANSITEVLFNMSTGDHIMGGCPMGRTADEGVVNERFEVFNYPGMYILDGSIMPCNPGVNPSLTITALSEYAMAQIPSKIDNPSHIGMEQSGLEMNPV